MRKFTPWYPMGINPVRSGEYEGREKGTGLRMPVHWRRLDGEEKAAWYFDGGNIGTLKLWRYAGREMSGWRGLAEKPKGLRNGT